MNRQTWAGGLVSAWAFVVAAPGDIVHVDRDAPGGGDGKTWATAYTDLQAAFADALGSGGAVTEIRVAEGEYRPAGPGGDRAASFVLLTGVAVRGGYPGHEAPDPDQQDIDAFETLLSGDLNGDDGPNFENNAENSYHVVTGSGCSPTAVLDGFTVCRGNADGSTKHGRGGGLYNSTGSPTIVACTFRENSAQFGGAVHNRKTSTPSLMGCAFVTNRATQAGGAVYNWLSDPVMTNCTVLANAADLGGGLCNVSSSPKLTCCGLADNGAAFGAGLYNTDGSGPALFDCVLQGNAADYSGGGMYNLYQSDAVLVNCVFDANGALSAGGAMFNGGDSSPALTNCTAVGNIAGFEGGGIRTDGGVLSLANCILWGNSDEGGFDESAQLYVSSGRPRVAHCCIQGWTGEGWFGAACGGGMIGEDPLFDESAEGGSDCGTGGHTVQLQAGSPCINAGTNYAPDLPAEDLEGNPRIGHCRVDLGACESPHPPAGFNDCNDNQVDDDCDVFHATSADCSRNHLPDECEPLEVVAVHSTAAHQQAGEFALALGVCPEHNRIEPRLASVGRLVCQMNVPVAQPAPHDPVTVTCEGAEYQGATRMSVEDGGDCPGTAVVVTFTPPLPDGHDCTVMFDGLVSVHGQPSQAEVAVTLLAGDVDRDGVVDSVDLAGVKGHLGQQPGPTTFLYDVATDGVINSVDLSAIKPRLGGSAPSCP